VTAAQNCNESAAVVLARVVGRLTSVLPGVSAEEARSLLKNAGAQERHGLRNLDRFLAAEPGALTVGVSDCPAAFIRLAHVLLDAGHDVSPPVCADCGRPASYLRSSPGGRLCSKCSARKSSVLCARCGSAGRPAARRDEGVICYACYSKDPEVMEACAACGRVRLPAIRQEDGAALCVSCWHRPERECGTCGEVKPVKATRDGQPACESCYRQPERLCGRCGRIGPIALRATDSNPDLCQNCYQGVTAVCSVCGRSRPCAGSRSGTYTCKSCLPRPRRECCRCHRIRPVNAEWPVGLVCSTCYEYVRNHPGTCSVCGETQPLIAGEAQAPSICGPCAGLAVDYNCRRCGKGGRIYADGTCSRCVLGDRLDDLLRQSDGTIAPQLTPLRDALAAVEHPVTILGWLRKSSSARLVASLASEENLVTHEHLDRLTQDRSLHTVRQILVHTGVLPQRKEYLERLGPWLEERLTSVPGRHAQLIRPFAHRFVFRRARKTSERRAYTHGAAAAARNRISSAIAFLRWMEADNLDLATLSQGDLDQWLVSGEPHRREIRSFLAWAASRRLAPGLTVPQRSSGQMPAGIQSEEDLGQQLQRCLTDMALPVDVRAAGAILTLFGLPLSKIVQLTIEHLTECDDDVYLTMDKQPVLMPPRLAVLLHSAACASSRSALGRSLPGTMWLFPGFSPGRHQVANTLGRRLREHGIQSRSTRNTAVITLASDLPAPILADLLGLHITTAERWVGYARRDWTAYLAARDSEQRSPCDGPSVTRSDTKRNPRLAMKQGDRYGGTG